jgi:hypothetical protein
LEADCPLEIFETFFKNFLCMGGRMNKNGISQLSHGRNSFKGKAKEALGIIIFVNFGYRSQNHLEFNKNTSFFVETCLFGKYCKTKA